MAFFKTTIPFTTLKGPLGKIDRTINRDSGLSLRFTERNGSFSLERKTAATRTNTPKQQEASDRYFKCDCKWKKISPACRLEIQKTQMEIGTPYEKTLPVYHYFMRYCLFGTECDNFLFYNCLETQASYTEYDTYLDVRGFNVNGICNLKSRLILNGQVHEEKISGNDGHVQFILSKDDLKSGNNEIYVQICFKLSNKLEYSVQPSILNGSFETGDFTDWTHWIYASAGYNTYQEITNETAQHGTYSYKASIHKHTKTGYGQTFLTQNVNFDTINSISLWLKTLVTASNSEWLFMVNIGGVSVLYLFKPTYPNWTNFNIDTSAITGTKELRIRTLLRSKAYGSGWYYAWIDYIMAS